MLHRASKIITSPLRWIALAENRYRLDARILAPSQNDILRLVCSLGKTNHSFCVLYQNYPIRKYTKHFVHISRSTGEIFRRPHKHIWDEDSEDDRAYIPTDIDPESSIDDQLIAFLEEENITLKAGYQRLLLR